MLCRSRFLFYPFEWRVCCQAADKVAFELVANVSATKIAEKVDLLEWLVERKDKRIEKNPAGFLVSAIREDYPLPKGFKSKAARQTEREELLKRKRKREEEEEVRQRQRDAEEQVRNEALSDHLENLSPADRVVFECEAVESDNGLLRKQWKKGDASKEIYFQMMLRNHFERIRSNKQLVNA